MRTDYEKNFIQYLGYNKIDPAENNDANYIIYYMDISNDLFVKLKQNSITTIYVYIGLSENPQEVPVLDSVPPDTMIAKYDRKGFYAPYVTPKISIE